MEISLIGFMGTGKSTVGKLLSEKLNLPLLETDKLIEKDVNLSIPEIFDQKGEDFFRRKETEFLELIVTEKNDYILSTGGGIVLSRKNRKLLKQHTMPVLLEASPKTIYSRIKKSEERRPLLETEDPLAEIKSLMKARKDYYHQFKTKIKTDNKSPGKIVKIIIDRLGVD